MRSALPLLLVVLLAAAGCDVRPLTSAELYGVKREDAGHDAPSSKTDAPTMPAPDAAPTDAPPMTTPDAGMDAALDADAGAPLPCAGACTADQFCDELTGRCAARAGAGMLSGVVRDACTGEGLDALVGIGGHHTCSFDLKGSYFLSGLPLGKLEVAAAKAGYTPYGVAITIVPGGVIHDIQLARPGGCESPKPARVACVCAAPTCQP